jgi:hypothetical protein
MHSLSIRFSNDTRRNERTMDSPDMFASPSLIRIKRHPKRNQVSHENSATSIDFQNTLVRLLLL